MGRIKNQGGGGSETCLPTKVAERFCPDQLEKII